MPTTRLPTKQPHCFIMYKSEHVMEVSLYNEVQVVQVELVHVWRDLVLYRGIPVQWGPSCTDWTCPCLEGPCTVQRGPCTMRSKLYRLNMSMSGGTLYCTKGSLYNEVQVVQVELVHVWRGLVLYRGFSVQWGPSCTDWTCPCLEGPCTVQRGPSMQKSKLYRLNLSISVGTLYCTEGSQYGEVQVVQVELLHVWRDLVLYRGVPVQWGPSCTGWTCPCLEGPCTVQRCPCTIRSKLNRLNLSMSGGTLYCTEVSLYNEVQVVQIELVLVWRDLVLYRGVPVCRSPSCTGWTCPCLEGPCTVQMCPCTMRSKLYRLNLSMSGGALYCTEVSLYNEAQVLQVELVFVWRALVLWWYLLRIDSWWRLCNTHCLFTLETILIGYHPQNYVNKQWVLYNCHPEFILNKYHLYSGMDKCIA